jgi:hypothetical protein
MATVHFFSAGLYGWRNCHETLTTALQPGHDAQKNCELKTAIQLALSRVMLSR